MKKLILILAVILISVGAHAQTDASQKKANKATTKQSSGYNKGDPTSPNVHNDDYENYDVPDSAHSAANKQNTHDSKLNNKSNATGKAQPAIKKTNINYNKSKTAKQVPDSSMNKKPKK